MDVVVVKVRGIGHERELEFFVLQRRARLFDGGKSGPILLIRRGDLMLLFVESRQVILRCPPQRKVALGVAGNLAKNLFGFLVISASGSDLALDENYVKLRDTVVFVFVVNLLESLLAEMLRLI